MFRVSAVSWHELDLFIQTVMLPLKKHGTLQSCLPSNREACYIKICLLECTVGAHTGWIFHYLLSERCYSVVKLQPPLTLSLPTTIRLAVVVLFSVILQHAAVIWCHLNYRNHLCAPQSIPGNHPFAPSSIFCISCWLCHHNLPSWPICCCCWCFHRSACVFFVVSPLNLWFYGAGVNLLMPVIIISVFVCAVVWLSGRQFEKERLWNLCTW